MIHFFFLFFFFLNGQFLKTSSSSRSITHPTTQVLGTYDYVYYLVPSLYSEVRLYTYTRRGWKRKRKVLERKDATLTSFPGFVFSSYVSIFCYFFFVIPLHNDERIFHNKRRQRPDAMAALYLRKCKKRRLYTAKLTGIQAEC